MRTAPAVLAFAAAAAPIPQRRHLQGFNDHGGGISIDSGGIDLSEDAFGREVVYLPKNPHGYFDSDAIDCKDKSALHISALSDSSHQIRAIVNQLGYHVDYRAYKCLRDYPNGVTALMMSASKGRATALKTLLELGADATIEDDDGHTAEKIAEYWGRDLRQPARSKRCKEAYRILVEHRQSNQVDKHKVFDAESISCHDLSPLHESVLLGQIHQLVAMVTNLGYNVDKRAFKCGGLGVTPLMLAASKGLPTVARTLLGLHADPFLLDDRGHKAEDMARYWSQTHNDKKRRRGCHEALDIILAHQRAAEL